MLEERFGFIIRKGKLKPCPESFIVQEIQHMKAYGQSIDKLIEVNKHLLSSYKRETCLEEGRKMNLKYEVETLVKDDSILQSVYSDFEDVREKMFSELLDLREAATREALIKLGWTPPEGS